MSDYINIFDFKDDRYPFQIIIGGRGSGKTYSALEHVTNEEYKRKFIFMRRTKTELDLLVDTDRGEGANPFKPINRDFGRNIGLKSIVQNLAGVYQREEDIDTGKLTHFGQPLGYGIALTTISSMRGLDFSDCDDWIYDEFIAEKHVRKIHGECDALLNAYETINRNREFTGEKPINLWLLANSNDIYNPVFVGLGIVSDAEKMQRKNIPTKLYPDRGLALHILPPAESFVEKKSKTALYKLTAGTSYYDMALNNEFAYNDFSLIGYRKLVGFTPLCAVDNAYIYRKKGESEVYVTYAPSNAPRFNSREQQDIIKFKQRYGCMLQPYYVNRKIVFETYELKERILSLIL